MLKNYLKIAWRNILRQKGYTAINVIGLAFGVAACLMIWFITHYELSYEQFQPGRERIFRVVSEIQNKSRQTDHWGNIPEPAAAQMRLEISGIEKIANFHNYNMGVGIPDGKGGVKKFPKVSGGQNNEDFVFAEPQYFELFRYEWVAGNPATALKDPFHVVLSTSEAQKYFGRSDWSTLMGRRIVYDDSLTVVISGIVKDWDKPTDLHFKDFVSYSTLNACYLKEEMALDQWGNFSSSSETFVKVAPGVSAARIESELRGFVVTHLKNSFDKGQTYRMLLQPLADLHFSAEYDKDYGREVHLPTLYGLMGIAVFILIIAAINFINLSIAQSFRRAKEIGVRKVLGSSRWGLAIQFLSETFFLTLLALLISLCLMRPILSSFPTYVPKGVTVPLSDPATLLFVAGILVVTTLLSGFYPAWVMSAGRQIGSGRNGLRKALVIFQFTLSVAFIIATIVIGDQMHFMLHKDMGFAKDAIVIFGTNRKDSPEKRKSLADRMRVLPGVEKVSRDWFTPAFSGAAMTTMEYSGREVIKTQVNFRVADENYIPLYELKLIAGRNFFPGDSLREIVINENYASQLGFRHPGDALGKTVKWWGKTCTIVGVAADFNIKPLREKIGPVAIGSSVDREFGFSVKLHSSGGEAAEFKKQIAAIERSWKAVFPDEPFVYHFFDDQIAKFYEKEQKTSQIISAAMFITIFISCMGLFGLAALTAAQRTREIGIRKVLGASVSGIVILLCKDFVLLVLIALALSSPIAWYLMNRWLQDFVYRVNIDWWVFALAGVSAIVIALVTVSFQSIKTALLNPIRSLRAE
jgi:putative ABC transport system permease protein